MSIIRIIGPEAGGLGRGTRVLDENGAELVGVSAVEIRRFGPGDLIVATIDISSVTFDLHATALLSEECLRAAASHYGYDLVPKVS